MPKMKATRGLRGDYGTIAPDQIFECNDQTAESLASRGLAVYHFAGPIYETKVVVPQPAQMVPIVPPLADASQRHQRNSRRP